MKHTDAIPNLRHLRMFVTICHSGSINAAAGALHIAQPAITQAISKLETRFAAPLLVRRRGGSAPTAEGDILFRRCERLFRQIDAAILHAPERALAPSPQQAASLAARLTVSQVLSIIAVARNGSLLMAARDSGLSVSAMHRATREIEGNLGYPIFVRTSSGLNVNRTGAELARRLQVAFREIAIAEEEIRSLFGPVNGRILIGSLPMIRSSLLGLAINRTLAAAPGLRFEVQEGVYPTMLNALRVGEVDMLIGALRRPPPADDIEQRLLFVDPYAVIARKGHPLQDGAAGVQDLADFEWVVQKQGTPVRAALEALFEGSGFRPSVAVETSSMSLSRSILLGSDRLCILSRRQIAIEEKAGLLRSLPTVLPSDGRSIGLTTRTDWLPGQSHRLFLENFYAVLLDNVGTIEERL